MLHSVCLLLFVTAVHGFSPSETYSHSEVFGSNGDFKLYWKYNSTHMIFETIVNTHGFIGFGISLNGTSMYPADVVVGWVANGIPTFQDYHTIGHSPPVLDAQQDWFLLASGEDETGTMLKFYRELDTTSDKVDGNHIHPGVPPLIWSFGDQDGLTYHATNRGAKFVRIMDSDSPAVGR